MFRTALFAAFCVACASAQAPSGSYAGSKDILGVTINGNIKIDSATAFDLGITGAATINCANEAYTYADGKVDVTNQGTSGDCVHDALKKNGIELKSIEYDAGKDEITVNVKKSIIGISLTLKHDAVAVPSLRGSSHNNKVATE